MEAELRRTSRFLSYVLRHHPETLGLELDPNGWVDVDILLTQAQANGRPIGRPLLEEVVRENDKQRFAFSADGSRIRASQGHSVDVDLQLPPLVPPETLFHGTGRGSLDAILDQGLTPRGRLQVHLSADPDTAEVVGRRHGRPVVLTVAAGAMHRDGIVFTRSANGVWLVSAVPPAYLSLLTPTE